MKRVLRELAFSFHPLCPLSISSSCHLNHPVDFKSSSSSQSKKSIALRFLSDIFMSAFQEKDEVVEIMIGLSRGIELLDSKRRL